MVRIDQVGRTAASALLLDESGEVVPAPERSSADRDGARAARRPPASTREGGRAAGRSKSRARGRRAPADSEDAAARREAGLHESPTAIDSEPEDVPAPSDAETEDSRQGEGGDDGLQSKPRRRGRRGGRRRSAAKAPATPE